jgi:quinol monooxygenase YgiN
MTTLRRRFGNEALVSISCAVYGLAMLVVAYARLIPVLMVLLLAAGASWMGALSSLNTTTQLAVPGWVKGRALSIYLMSLFGGLTLGSWFWGRIAADYSVHVSLTAAGLLGLLALGLRHRYRLPGFEDLDLTPAEAWPEPVVAFDVDPEAGPVLITVEYQVVPERAEEFALLMHDVRRIRRRDGASGWELYRDVERPDCWLEAFTVNSWAEHLRQHRRGTVEDTRILQRAADLHCLDGPPKVTHLVAQEPGQGRIIPMPDQPAG